jgi:ribosome maturation protein SDO1
MIPLDKAVVARLESHAERFELLVDPDEASRFKQGEPIEIEDIVAALNVFENAAHGDRASDETLMKVFGTLDFPTIAKRIIEKGEIHLTSDQRRHMIADKRKQVVNFIARNAVNPQTGYPHPPTRIEMAMEEARVNIDPFRHLDDLVKDTMKALRPLIPIRFEELRLAVKIPPDYAAKSFPEIRAGAVIEKDEWQRDGSWICVVRIPAGIQNEFYTTVNRLTKGEGEVKKLNQIY